MKKKYKTKINTYFCIVVLFMAIIFANCATRQHNEFAQYNLTLRDSLTIFLLNNENNHFFCIFLQYIGDFQISNFEFNYGNILIGEYHIPLNRENVRVLQYFNEVQHEYYFRMNQYSFFIERHLTDSEMRNIINQYKNGKVNSGFYIWFDFSIDNYEQRGSGVMDNFRLYNGPIDINILRLFPHFEIFMEKYL